MSEPLDDIRTQIDCPDSGTRITTTYGTLRITGVVACKCGTLVIAGYSNSDIAKVTEARAASIGGEAGTG